MVLGLGFPAVVTRTGAVVGITAGISRLVQPRRGYRCAAHWVPRTDSPEWNDYLAALAAAAVQQVRDLGEQTADEATGWATEAFGPPPRDEVDREDWDDQPVLRFSGVVRPPRRRCGLK